MRFIKVASLVAAGLLGWAQAHALPIVQAISIGTSTAPAGTPSIGSPASYALFDETLGTLDYVQVRILGTWRGTGNFEPCLCLSLPPPAGMLPVSYQVAAQFDQEIRGIGAGSDIGFVISPSILFSATVPVSLSVSGVVLYDIAFRFDATTDSHGIAAVSGGGSSLAPRFVAINPPLVQGTRADFIGTGPAFFQNVWQSTYQVIAPGLPTTTFSYSYQGTMSLTYEYTPFDTEGPVVPVDEPGTLALLGAGALVPLLIRRGRREGRIRPNRPEPDA